MENNYYQRVPPVGGDSRGEIVLENDDENDVQMVYCQENFSRNFIDSNSQNQKRGKYHQRHTNHHHHHQVSTSSTEMTSSLPLSAPSSSSSTSHHHQRTRRRHWCGLVLYTALATLILLSSHLSLVQSILVRDGSSEGARSPPAPIKGKS